MICRKTRGRGKAGGDLDDPIRPVTEVPGQGPGLSIRPGDPPDFQDGLKDLLQVPGVGDINGHPEPVQPLHGLAFIPVGRGDDQIRFQGEDLSPD